VADIEVIPTKTITLPADQWQAILDAVECHWDEGPPGEGWQSPLLSAASAALSAALAQPEPVGEGEVWEDLKERPWDQYQTVPEPEGLLPRVGHILRLAEIIREVDGNHDKGTAALAEAILSHPGSRWQPSTPISQEVLGDG
jgi:hypothetical protein